MKRIARAWIVVLLAVLVTGCVTVGRDFDEQVVMRIEKGKTTKAQIQDWLGSPYEKGVGNKLETWTYRFIKNTGLPQEKTKALTIWFEKNGVVNSFDYTTNNSAWQVSR